MRFTLLFVATLAGTAFSGPLMSDVDVRAHLARGSVSINNGQESTRGFARRGGPRGPALEENPPI